VLPPKKNPLAMPTRPSATGPPSAFTRPGGCEVGVVRGGSFASAYRGLAVGAQARQRGGQAYQTVGFRVALSLDAQ